MSAGRINQPRSETVDGGQAVRDAAQREFESRVAAFVVVALAGDDAPTVLSMLGIPVPA